jgi:hypothetical protein
MSFRNVRIDMNILGDESGYIDGTWGHTWLVRQRECRTSRNRA